jgi:hypothetical protein
VIAHGVVGQRVAAHHPLALDGNAPHRGGLVWHVLVVRGGFLTSLWLVSLLAGGASHAGTEYVPKGGRIVGLTTVLALLPVAAWAHLLGAEADEALARSLNLSILFLLSMPVAIFGAIFATVYIAQKRAQRHVREGNETRSH